jgi:hypothetical protein
MMLARDDFTESEHPRGKPGNPGQFASKPGGGEKSETGGEGKGETKEASKSERLTGESDKEFAKRVIAKRESPKSLPEKYNRYFHMSAQNVKIIPLDKLVPSKPEEQTKVEGERATKYMDAASNGELEKREPLTVKRLPGGKFEIVDGNGTFSGVKQYGWKGLPAVVEGEQKLNIQGNLARKTSGDDTQPVKSLDELYERAKKAEGPFKDAVSLIAKQFNCKVEYTPPEYAEPGTILKSRKSAERKLTSELSDNPTLLRDVIRATIVSSTAEGARKAAVGFIEEHGDNVLRVKDRYVDRIGGGYRDLLINYRTPEGLVAEVQFNSKNMVKTKNESAHVLYEKQRELKNPTPDMLDKLNQQMSEMYETAYRADGDGRWRKGGKLNQAQDAENEKLLRCYQLSLDGGPSFQAVIADENGVMKVLSNRNGKWAPEEVLSWVDLVMPEQKLNDWDVTQIEPDQLAEDAEPLEHHRALDRTFDIEYFTNESLGPNRERTPEGFLICYDVPVARVGEMVYGPGEVPAELGLGRDGRVRVARSAAEVFSPKSMASLNGKPVTDDHPPVDVDPSNWKFYTKGIVVNPRRGDGEQRDFLIADLIVYDGSIIDDIEAGKREVSCGYNPDYLQLLDDSDNPIQGRGEQVNILYNHLALVAAGRCGPACAVGDRKTVDSATDSIWTPERVRRLRRLADRL